MAEVVDYRPYLDGDVWPSQSKGNEWVGDMPPAHAANSIGKLLRWAEEQPARNHADELENEHTVRASRLYRFLAARATYTDFVDAEHGVTANGVIAAVHDEVPYAEQLGIYATAISEAISMEPGDLVRTSITVHESVTQAGFTIVQKEK